MGVAIKVENLSKAYQIGQFSTGTVSRDLERWWITKILGKEDPFLKIGENNDRTKKGQSDIVWSLKNLNFDIEQGDAVGIIGNNGAGKSTLLKILSRVTGPTKGSIKIKGRVASLLEVGTGFHPELTGRENIFLNGAILGMNKKEIRKKFDEIVDFAGVERYIDTPVKRYSSGMYVRLAFAVAAHLESEVLIVDEVLAVGDAEFQKKCLGKMGDISKSQGRTILFVSHNMVSVKSLCEKGIYLKNGKALMTDRADKVINVYQNEAVERVGERYDFASFNSQRYGSGRVKFTSVDLALSNDEKRNIFITGDDFKITTSLKAQETVKDVTVALIVYSIDGFRIIDANTSIKNRNLNFAEGEVKTISFLLQNVLLKPGHYLLGMWTGRPGEDMDGIQYALKFEVNLNYDLQQGNISYPGLYQCKYEVNDQTN